MFAYYITPSEIMSKVVFKVAALVSVAMVNDKSHYENDANNLVAHSQ